MATRKTNPLNPAEPLIQNTVVQGPGGGSPPQPVAADEWREGTQQLAPREAHQEPAQVIAYPGGRTLLNAAGSKLSDEIARDRGIDPGAGYFFKYLINGRRGSLALIPVSASGPGIVAALREKQKRTVRYFCHLAAAYKDEPAIKPATRVKCIVTTEQHWDGKPMLVLHLRAGKVMVTQPRKRETDQG